MRIWVLNHYAVPRSGAGGTAHAVWAHYLAQAGHDVTLFPASIGFGHGTAHAITAGRRFSDTLEDGVRFRYVRTCPYRNSVGRLLNMLSYRRNVVRAVDGLEPPDVIIGSCVHPWAVDAAIRLAKEFSVPFVYQIRDIWPQSLVEMKALRQCNPLYWYLRRLELRAFRTASGVTGVLPGIQRYAEAHGVPSDRICYFPNGVDPASYPEPSPPPQGKPFLISYFGAHGPANDLGTVLEAAAIVQRSAGADAVRVRLVGDGSEKPALIRRSQDLGLRNTEFRAPVPKPQLAALAQESCAFVFHLRRLPVIERHGLSSNKLFDYLLAARPVIFACKSLNNPVGEAGAGLCADCENPQGIADAAVRLRSMSSDERWHMGTRGRQYVLAHHDLSKLAIRLQEFLAAILERHAKSRSGHCE